MTKQTSNYLIIKISSLGDIVHMLPAISDAVRKKPDLSFDWVIERDFTEVPAWHTQINRVVPVDVRKWHKNMFAKKSWKELFAFMKLLRQQRYKKVIDSQGLLKSAVLSCMAKGPRWGYDKASIREPAANYLYQYKVSVPKKAHAVTRNRLVLAKTLGYSIDDLQLDYGIIGNEIFDIAFKSLSAQIEIPEKYIVALHGTSRKDKEWPVNNWHEFVKEMEAAGYAIFLPWGNEEERNRADLLADQYQMASTLPKCSLTTLGGLIQNASAVIGMDTGLMHIAAAFNKKGIALYPSTQPELTGVMTKTDSIESISGEQSLDVKLVNSRMLSLL